MQDGKDSAGLHKRGPLSAPPDHRPVRFRL